MAWTFSKAGHGRDSWARVARTHHFGYRPTGDVPAGDGSGVPYNRGSNRSVSHVLTGDVPPAILSVGERQFGAGLRPGTFTSCRYRATMALGHDASTATAAYHVLDVTLPAALPIVQLSDRHLGRQFGLPNPHWLQRSEQVSIHQRLDIASPVDGLARMLVTADMRRILDRHLTPMVLLIEGPRARLVSPDATSPNIVLGRLATLTELVAAIPAAVWRLAGLDIADVSTQAAPGWENGLPGNNRRQLPTRGPAWM